jgi:hypothetical protein
MTKLTNISLPVFIGSMALVLATGCSAEVDGQVPEGALEATQGSSETIDSIGAALASDECTTGVTADTVLAKPWSLGLAQSPTSYGKNGCGKAYLVEISDWARYPSIGHHDYVSGMDLPSSQGACEKIRTGVYFWVKGGNSYSFAGNFWKWGTWDGQHCLAKVIGPEFDAFVGRLANDGSTVRYAMTSRTCTTAGNAGTCDTLRRVKAGHWDDNGAAPLPPR